MRITIGRITAITLTLLTCNRHVLAAGDAAYVKLLEPKPLIEGHKVVILFPPGHPALKAGAGADQEEKFNMSKGRVASVTNIHNPSLELYLAPAENPMCPILFGSMFHSFAFARTTRMARCVSSSASVADP